MQRTTRRLTITTPHPASQAIAEAAALIRGGGLVAFPTETVYGLGANALDAGAVQRIFSAKQRPASDPLIVHIASMHDMRLVAAELPPALDMLVRLVQVHFWPGPLTVIVPRGPAVPANVTAGRETVAVRMPAHPIAHHLIRAADTPIAAPSANRFGHTSPTTADHVLTDLDGRIDMVLDGGPTPIGVESTVLDLTASPPVVLRPGGISLDELCAHLGRVEMRERVAVPEHTLTPGVGLAAPGMLERHYAPDAELWLCIGPPAAARAWMLEQAGALGRAGQRVGVLVYEEDRAQFAQLAAPVDVEVFGSERHPQQIAQRLYAALRALDARHPDVILARDAGSEGLALAITDRLTRAASGRVVRLEPDSGPPEAASG